MDSKRETSGLYGKMHELQKVILNPPTLEYVDLQSISTSRLSRDIEGARGNATVFQMARVARGIQHV